MGRKAIKKSRKNQTAKMSQWLELLLVKLQSVELSDLTIDDLAKMSGKSKATIYKYFESKEDVILAACQTRIKVVMEIVFKIQQDKTTPIEVRYSRLLEQFSAGVSDITISFLHDIKNHYPTSWAAINLFSDSFVTLLEELYLTGMNNGLFRPMPIELLGTLDKYFVTQIVTNRQIFRNPEYTLNYLIRDYLLLRLEGLNK
ncbi:MAG: TetR/AcrR family transcriptional regulator [Crocinitomicaceae bacterium]|nr:TetR/AcrR family transcriptional regulator [Crocinitomicaceae bacterium]